MKDENFPASDTFKEPTSEKVRAGIAEAVTAARDVDVVIAVLGETDDLCTESASRVSLDLPGYQEDLLRALSATGKPLVLVLSNGRPLSVNWAAKHVPAIVEMWFPGETGGAALADVLFGDCNPSGRLPITFPRGVGQIPMNFPFHPGAHGEDFGQVTGPLFPFGFGLSYTTFAYDHLRISPSRQGPGGDITVSCDVTNTGRRAGDAVVQLYLRDDYASVVTFDSELRGFSRVPLAPGETKTATFTLTPDQLQVFDRDEHWTVEPGRFTVMIGESSADIRLQGNFWIDSATPAETPLRAPDGITRVACVGDSITAGSGLWNRDTDSFPAVLGQTLGGRFQVANFGISGAEFLRAGNLPYWDSPYFRGARDYAPAVVVIALGTNDSKPANWAHAADFEADATAFVKHFAGLPSKPGIVLCLPPPVYENGFKIEESNLAVIRAAITRVAASNHWPLVDLVPPFAGRPDLLIDGVHPTPAGDRLIAETLRPAIEAALAEKTR